MINSFAYLPDVYFRATLLTSEYFLSRPKVFCKIGDLKNLTKFIGKHLTKSHLFNKVETLAQLLSCNFGKILKNIYFLKQRRENASIGSMESSRKNYRLSHFHDKCVLESYKQVLLQVIS